MNISIKFFFFTQMVAYCVHHSGHSFFYLVINPGDHSSECGSNSFYSIIWLLHSFTNCYILNENLSYLEFFVIIVDGKKKEISYNLQCIPSNIEINVFVGQIPRNGVNRLKEICITKFWRICCQKAPKDNLCEGSFLYTLTNSISLNSNLCWSDRCLGF